MTSVPMRLLDNAGRRLPPTLLLLLAAAFAAPASGEPAAAPQLPEPILVNDFSPGSHEASFVPRNLAVIGQHLFFSGSDPQHGEEPWVTDNTPGGTRRLADLCPGTCDSSPRDFTAVGDRVVFGSFATQRIYAFADDQVVELADNVGIYYGFEVLDDIAYFRSGPNGAQIKRTDGTVEGTRPTLDLCNVEACSSGPSGFQAIQDVLYFTQGGTLSVLVAEGDRRPLAALDHAQEFTALDADRVVFQGCRAAGCSAWVSDGTAAGTFPLETELTPGQYDPRHFVAWRGRIYFRGPQGQMKSTDGTPAGTVAEPSFTGSKPTPFAANATHLLYTVEVPAEVFTEDVLRARANGGSDVALVQSPSIRPEGRDGDTLYFMASQTLTATDGTPGGTHSLYEVYGHSQGVEFADRYFFGLDPNGGEIDGGLWLSDGTFAGTEKIDLGIRYPNGTAGSVLGMASFVVASLGPGNGMTDDLYRLGSLSLELTDTDPARRLYLHRKGFDLLYAHDTENGQLVALTAGASVPLPGGGHLLESALGDGDRLYYTEATPGQQLFETDGTVAGTRSLFDLRPGYVPACSGHHCEPDFPQSITPSGDNVFFVAPSASGDATGTALWVWSRGGGAPVELLQLTGAFYGMAAAPGGRVIFESRIGLGPGERLRLWTSDGTVAGTQPFFQLPGFGDPSSFTRAGGRVFFTLPGANGGLWITDLTAAGTYQLAAADGMNVTGIVAASDHVFFTGIPAAGQETELGYSDGTPAGTRWLDIVPGPRGLRPDSLHLTHDQRLVFAAAGDAAGQELWLSDGSLAGTYRLTDLAPGPDASSPRGITSFGNRVFFMASDGVAGFEPWALDLPPSLQSCPSGQLCLQQDRFEVKATAHVPQPGGGSRSFQGHRALGTAESGVFRFFSLDNWELLVKVLDACHITGSYWVSAAAASDVAYDLEVLDRATGRRKTYAVPAGGRPPILDTGDDFGCAADPVAEIHAPQAPPSGLAPRCADDGESLCLGAGGRFRVQLDWRTGEEFGRAHPLVYGSADTGLFTFFSPSNWEMMVKVLDGCSINGKFWVFGAGSTDVGWTLSVTDRTTQQRQVYQNRLGNAAPPITDIAAFDCRP